MTTTTTPAGKSLPHLFSLTFLANQTPLAWVIHSREWMPVSIQMAGRRLPPVLNWVRQAGRREVGQETTQLGPHTLPHTTPKGEALGSEDTCWPRNAGQGPVCEAAPQEGMGLGHAWGSTELGLLFSVQALGPSDST